MPMIRYHPFYRPLPHAFFHDLASMSDDTARPPGSAGFHATLQSLCEMPLVSISNADGPCRRAPIGSPRPARHRSACLPVRSQGAGDSVAFPGAYSPEKRPDQGHSDHPRRAGVYLKVAAKVRTLWTSSISRRRSALLDHPLVESSGKWIDGPEMPCLGQHGRCVSDTTSPEPSGWSLSSYVGRNSVIAWRNGSVPEIIRDCVSGIIVNSINGAVAAVQEVSKLNRRAVQAEFEARFTAARMARNYVAAYRSLLARASAKTEAIFSANPRAAVMELAPGT